MTVPINRAAVKKEELAFGKVVYATNVRLPGGFVLPEGVYHVRETHVPLDSDEASRLYLNSTKGPVYIDLFSVVDGVLPGLYIPTKEDLAKGYAG